MIGTRKERLAFLDAYCPEWTPHTLWTRFSLNAQHYSDKPYLIFQDDIYRYGDVKKWAELLARGLYARGIRSGDHVAVFSYNGPIFLFLTFALAKLGAVKIPVNMKLKTAETCQVLNQSDAVWAVGPALPRDFPWQDVPAIRGTIDLMPDSSQSLLPQAIIEEAMSISTQEIDHVEQTTRNAHGICDILYTSGSTSLPKGVILTHDMLLRSSYATCRTRAFEEGRKIFLPIPFYHIMAYNEGLLAAMHVGGCLVVPKGSFDPANCVALMTHHRVNDIVCVSYVIQEILNRVDPKPSDFPEMHAAYWAASCPRSMWNQGQKAFGVSDITTAYGMTECTSTTTMIPAGAPAITAEDFVGKRKDAGAAGCFQNHLLELEIRDPETGIPCPHGVAGEITVRGITVTPGYYKNDHANAAAFTPDGWFRTGDLGRLNSDEYLTFEGRIDDMYKINGENISPQYIDSVIGQCQDVIAVETVGICHSRYGAIGVAFVDCGSEDSLAQNRVKQFCQEKLAPFQVPKHFVFESRRKWPRTSSNKIQKKALQKRALQMFGNQ